MPKYKVHCSVNWAGCDETIIVDASDESEAESLASEYWNETVCAAVNLEGEATEDELNDYPEI